MTTREACARLVAYFRKRDLDRDFDEEAAAHIDLLTQDLIRQGMTLPEARRVARVKFGGIEAAKEQHRDSRGLPWLDGVMQDVRFAIRAMMRSPGFTFTAVAMLALGIGVNVIVFTVTDAALFRGFPLVRENNRLVYLTSGSGCCTSYPDFVDWRAQAKSFDGMAAVHGLQKSYSDGRGFAETYITTDVSADTFHLVGQRPILGRDFTQADEIPGAPPVAILRYSFWQRRYGGDSGIIGRSVRINGELTTIIGVMPRGFSFPQNQELWMPMLPPPGPPVRVRPDTWFVFGRLAEGATFRTARAEMEIIGRRLAIAYPRNDRGRDLQPHLRNFHEFFIGPNSTTIYEAMLIAVGFVLLIACANLANLLLARAIGRSREISVRIALGAGRWRIIRQLLIESLMLSSLGGAAGWWVAKWGVRIYSLAVTGSSISDSIAGNWFDNVLNYTLDYRILAYLVAISVGTGILFGLAPAARLSKLDANTALKEGARGAAGGRRGKRLSAMLVIGEMALAMMLLAGAGVMIRSFLNIYNANIGVRTDHVLAALFSLPEDRYASPREQSSFYDRLQSRLAALPGVESVTIANSIPTNGARKFPYELDGADPVEQQNRPVIPVMVTGPGYFRTLETAILSGRDFTERDGITGIPVVIVNQRFASEYWHGQNPLGKRLRLFNGVTPEAWLTVIGVAPDIVQNDFTRQQIDSLIYLPYRQMPAATMWVLARTRVPPANLANDFRREVQAIDPDLPTGLGPFPLDGYLAWNYQYRGISGVLFLTLAGIALLLASIGLYAVVAHSVGERTQEIGIRMAVGATTRDILRLVFTQGILPLEIGLVVGLAGSLAVNRLLKSTLVHVSPFDPLTFVIAASVLVMSATLGCWIPARRAMNVDPVVALRHE